MAPHCALSRDNFFFSGLKSTNIYRTSQRSEREETPQHSKVRYAQYFRRTISKTERKGAQWGRCSTNSVGVACGSALGTMTLSLKENETSSFI